MGNGVWCFPPSMSHSESFWCLVNEYNCFVFIWRLYYFILFLFFCFCFEEEEEEEEEDIFTDSSANHSLMGQLCSGPPSVATHGNPTIVTTQSKDTARIGIYGITLYQTQRSRWPGAPRKFRCGRGQGRTLIFRPRETQATCIVVVDATIDCFLRLCW